MRKGRPSPKFVVNGSSLRAGAKRVQLEKSAEVISLLAEIVQGAERDGLLPETYLGLAQAVTRTASGALTIDERIVQIYSQFPISASIRNVVAPLFHVLNSFQELRIVGLMARPELNGARGRIDGVPCDIMPTDWPARVPFRITGGRLLKVSLKNLRAAAPEPSEIDEQD